jgi:hypothetical protein
MTLRCREEKELLLAPGGTKKSARFPSDTDTVSEHFSQRLARLYRRTWQTRTWG